MQYMENSTTHIGPCNLHLNQLRRCPAQLRTVKKETLDYMMLRDSIRDVGILMPLLVRPADGGYEVVAGSHRFEIACDLRIDPVPCNVRELTDAQVDVVQVIENANNVETTPVEYSRRLQKIIHHGEMDVNELAFVIHRHPDWVRKLLSLNHLCVSAKNLLDKGELSCKLGIELAKLPVDRQEALLGLNSSYPANEYLELLRQEVRTFRDNKKSNRVQQKAGIKPSFRNFRKVLNEYLEPTEKASVLTREEATTASEGWDACLAWILSSDPETLEKKLRAKETSEAAQLRRELSRNLEMKRRRNE